MYIHKKFQPLQFFFEMLQCEENILSSQIKSKPDFNNKVESWSDEVIKEPFQLKLWWIDHKEQNLKCKCDFFYAGSKKKDFWFSSIKVQTKLC